MQNCKMKICWVTLLIICQFRQYSCYHETSQRLPIYDPVDEFYTPSIQYHYPGAFTTELTKFINGTDTEIVPRDNTPDYRIEEPHYLPISGYIEDERPYLNSPAYKNYNYHSDRVSFRRKLMYEMGCYCNTVYKKFTLLAGCAVITTRHVLTTATPTMLVVRSYKHRLTLDGIFGGWYDHSGNTWNSSLYFQAARIHVHPDYTYDYEVNISHPIPAMYDLAVVALHKTVYCHPVFWNCAFICNRGGSGRFWYISTTPHWTDTSILAGFQFIKAFNRNPLPWFRYVIHTRQYVYPCPKSDWQWFHCIYGEYWGRYGFDSGGGMNSHYDDGWRYNGLVGLCAFSMKLRSKQTVHYFTVVDSYTVLDFLYDAILGLSKCVYVDDRFEDTKWAAPVPYWDSYIPWTYDWGEEQVHTMFQIPFY